jgi:hypothetical protein
VATLASTTVAKAVVRLRMDQGQPELPTRQGSQFQLAEAERDTSCGNES